MSSGTRSLADLIDNMGAPFQGNSMLSNLMPEGKKIDDVTDYDEVTDFDDVTDSDDVTSLKSNNTSVTFYLK